MNFGFIFEVIKNSTTKAMRLPYWSSEVYVCLQQPNEYSTHPYLVVHSCHGTVPWKPNIPEMWRDDWELIDKPTDNN